MAGIPILTMQLNQEHITTIKTRFQQMKTKEDLLELVNFAKELLHVEKAMPIPLRVLTYYGNSKRAQLAYKEFSIRKKSGGTRSIHAPAKGLKSIQKALNLILQAVFQPHPAATGFVPDKSIVDNARIHLGMHYVYNLDLKDFFPSVDMKRVAACLRNPPFNVVDTTEAPLAFLLANLCCAPIEVERQNEQGGWDKKVMMVLPQGAPTSPAVTNIICQRLDRQLQRLARHHGARYTRYADDITFSSLHNLYQPGSDFLRELTTIIEGQGFRINPKKTRLQKAGYRQEVTGLVVNEKVNVPRRYVKQIRHWLYLWERYGYLQAEVLFHNNYQADKGHVKKASPSLQNVLEGKLLYLKMVKGEGDSTYIGLYKRFAALAESRTEGMALPGSPFSILGMLGVPLEKFVEGKGGQNFSSLIRMFREEDGKLKQGIATQSDDQIIEHILAVWESQGIETAMEKLNALTSWMKKD